MNDYSDLIKIMRAHAEWADEHLYGLPIMLPDNLKLAADTIEQLVREREALTETYTELLLNYQKVKKERDAAIMDLNKARSCLTCKSDSPDFCEGCDSWRSRCNWKWRGVQK